MKAERTSLRDALTDNVDIAAIVADRVYPGLAPINATRPFITYQLTNTELSPAHDRATPATKRAGDRRTWILSLEGTDIDVLSDLADHVRTAIDGFTDATNLCFRVVDEADLPLYKDEQSFEIIQTIQIEVVSVRRPT